MTEPADDFITRLDDALREAAFVKLVLAKPRASAGDLQRVTARPITLKGEASVSFVYTHQTRDITKNLAPHAALAAVRALLAQSFSHAHLFTTTAELQLLISQRGKHTLVRGKPSLPASADPTTTPTTGTATAPATEHNRAKHRLIDADRPFLAALGVTAVDPKSGQLQIVPAMARHGRVCRSAAGGMRVVQSARLEEGRLSLDRYFPIARSATGSDAARVRRSLSRSAG